MLLPSARHSPLPFPPIPLPTHPPPPPIPLPTHPPSPTPPNPPFNPSPLPPLKTPPQILENIQEANFYYMVSGLLALHLLRSLRILKRFLLFWIIPTRYQTCYQGHISAALVLGGMDVPDPQMYTIHPSLLPPFFHPSLAPLHSWLFPFLPLTYFPQLPGPHFSSTGAGRDGHLKPSSLHHPSFPSSPLCLPDHHSLPPSPSPPSYKGHISAALVATRGTSQQRWCWVAWT
ncbi:unnamed protein product [Closterium sp. Naga37s-1]|nr:unnamed protein product [Closterium sp. Naga37s-1]